MLFTHVLINCVGVFPRRLAKVIFRRAGLNMSRMRGCGRQPVTVILDENESVRRRLSKEKNYSNRLK